MLEDFMLGSFPHRLRNNLCTNSALTPRPTVPISLCRLCSGLVLAEILLRSVDKTARDYDALDSVACLAPSPVPIHRATKTTRATLVMERRASPQATSLSPIPGASDANSRPCHEPRTTTGITRNANSYYDLYPERKRNGPYVPKTTLIAHDSILDNHSRASASKHAVVRRSRSGSQIDSHHTDSPRSTNTKQSGTSLRPPNPHEADGSGVRPVRRSASSTYAASSIALGRARPHAIAPQPVKSIDEIVRAHSSNLLGVPPSQRGPQRSISWSKFENTGSVPRSFAKKHVSHNGELSDPDSDDSEGSIEQEARAILKNAQVDHLRQSMSQLSVGSIDPATGSVRHDARQRSSARAASPIRSSPRQSPIRELESPASLSIRRGLTQCAQVKIPGTPNLLVSFADTGLEHGHPVMVFLGLGASRHLIGLYNELAASLGLRLICIDRWGIGRTDNIPPDQRNIMGWSFVVEQVADLLAIDKFSILAHSAGAPFAAAMALLFPHRIQGPLHLLAPWTGVQQDSGYRWLRYIPDGVIKTAHAAEWKIQSWKLNKEGTKSASRGAPTVADDEHLVDRRHDSDLSSKGPAPPPKLRTQRQATPPTNHAYPGANGSAVLSSSGRIGVQQEAATRDAVDGNRPRLGHEDEDSQQADAERSNALHLLKASHAESARGLVDDLNLVLGKRPWGFGYEDLRLACEVWHGSRDERIPLSSSVSLSKEMRDCTLHIVEGASHSLMTNAQVVIEVFEGIRGHSLS